MIKKILGSIVCVLALAALLYWAVIESKAEAKAQNERQAAFRSLLTEVHEDICIVDSAMTEDWMKHQACSERVKALVGYYDVVGSYPTVYPYRMRDGREGEVAATKLFFKMRLVY